MENFRGDFHTLYQMEEPHTPGLTLETHVNPVQVNDANPSEAEAEVVFCRLLPLKSGGHNHLHSEHFKQWL